MIVSDAKAFQSTLKMQLYDLPSSNFNLRVRQIFKHATCLDLHFHLGIEAPHLPALLEGAVTGVPRGLLDEEEGVAHSPGPGPDAHGALEVGAVNGHGDPGGGGPAAHMRHGLLDHRPGIDGWRFGGGTGGERPGCRTEKKHRCKKRLRYSFPHHFPSLP